MLKIAREKEDFRENLKRLDEKIPNKELVNISETAKVLGISRDKVREMFPFDENKLISKVKLARLIS